MQPNPFFGVGLHAVGAFSAASCYTPQKQTKLWAWEVYWISQATFAWLILPIVFAFLTVPDYLEVLGSVSRDVMLRSFLLGVIYGFGGLTFGLGIRYIGFSLNYAIAIGISAGLGTIFPLIWTPNAGFDWQLEEKFNNLPGLVVLSGIFYTWIGILFCGWAGALREQSSGAAPSQYSFKIGVPLAAMAGVFSAIFNYALIAGSPLAEAAKDKAGELLKMNAIYPFSNGGAWVTNFVICVAMIAYNRTGSQFLYLPGQPPGRLGFYYLMALLSGAFWYFQFFFYGMGQAFIGKQYEFTSWALHMALLIVFSSVYGVAFREWRGIGMKPRVVLYGGIAIIVAGTLLIAYGNDLGKPFELPPLGKD